eukprot:gnl/TRDRNA2_/TRDRNA2_176239_c0_seq1.p1 gnl/TRDRNA2_/TRDRNA2_176239_c0~~gnl/TRDRNA2_/TRDRNA2_176239_c0_seq1.p1  ORF type:complete len:379 (+),score=48.65 gnl/TRDRNA2_/TRDRNA2_176239_c0_seq1:81-1217(+)
MTPIEILASILFVAISVYVVSQSGELASDVMRVPYVLDWREPAEAATDYVPCLPTAMLNRAGYTLPVGSVLAYLLLVHFMPLRFGWKWLKPLFALWNFLCSAFACWGLAVSFPFMLAGYREKGLHYMVCSDEMTADIACTPRPIGLAMTYFALSKFPELLDTVFLVLMDTKVILLHWYHHVTVLLYCWWSCERLVPTCVTFATMNYAVHAVMYFYFGSTQFKSTQKVFGFMRKPITLLQTSQMAIGVFYVCLSYYFKATGECSKTYNSDYFFYCGAMYFSYLCLFVKLYHDSYVRKKTRPAKLEGSGNAGASKTDVKTAAAPAPGKQVPPAAVAGTSSDARKRTASPAALTTKGRGSSNGGSSIGQLELNGQKAGKND